MSEDRPVHTDALKTLGNIIDDKQGRDAIHLAVEPTVAKERLRPGQHVGVDGTRNNPVGIVDPFLAGDVVPGERFWLIVYPRTITSLRHVWEHPLFSDAQPVETDDHVAAIKQICVNLGCRYEELMDHTEEWLRHDEYWVDGGRWEGEHLPDEFWEHYEAIKGKVVPKDKRYSFFSCSC